MTLKAKHPTTRRFLWSVLKWLLEVQSKQTSVKRAVLKQNSVKFVRRCHSVRIGDSIGSEPSRNDSSRKYTICHMNSTVEIAGRWPYYFSASVVFSSLLPLPEGMIKLRAFNICDSELLPLNICVSVSVNPIRKIPTPLQIIGLALDLCCLISLPPLFPTHSFVWLLVYDVSSLLLCLFMHPCVADSYCHNNVLKPF